MRQGLSCLVIVCGVFLYASPAQAVRFSGNYLLGVCASDAKGNELVQGGHAVCQSYIAAIIDYHTLVRSLNGAPSVDFCVPDAVPMNKLQNIVAAYIYKHKDQHGSFIASPAVALALYAVYPCKGKT